MQYDENLGSLLPDTLHELLDLALNDFIQIKDNDEYEIDFNTWHSIRQRGGKCHVCLAGTVIANTFKVDRSEFIEMLSDYFYDRSVIKKLQVLDRLAEYRILSAWRILHPGENIPDAIRELDDYYEQFPFYFQETTDGWISDQRRLISDLKKEGL